MQPVETFEYGFLHGFVVDGLRHDDQDVPKRQSVCIVETGPGRHLVAGGRSLLSVMNELGQDGWMITQSEFEVVQNNLVHPEFAEIIRNEFDALGHIQARKSFTMSRRIVWDADAQSD